MTTPVALTIAGSDSSGGAGIQADLKTFAALGVYGASVITALTAQNTTGVSGIHLVPADFVTAQIDAVFSDLDVNAVKIGMVAQLATIDAIVAALTRWSPEHVVLDPVMVATSGDRLLATDAIEALRSKTHSARFPGDAEPAGSAALLDEPVASSDAVIESQGKRLLAMGCRAVLIKGGHGQGAESIDYLFSRQGHHRAGGAAHRDEKHPRHRMLIVVGYRRRPCQGRRHGNRRSQGQSLDQRGDRGGRSTQRRPRPWTDPSFSSFLLNVVPAVHCRWLVVRSGSSPAQAVIALSRESVSCSRMGSDAMSEECPERRFRTLFISDVHLGARGSQADRLLDFLRSHDADTIYLVGDIVDGWALQVKLVLAAIAQRLRAENAAQGAQGRQGHLRARQSRRIPAELLRHAFRRHRRRGDTPSMSVPTGGAIW